MKTFRMLGMVVVAIMMSLNFVACSNEDTPEGYDEMIVGTWENEVGDIYVFKKGGAFSYIDMEYDSSVTGTWTIAGDMLSMTSVVGTYREIRNEQIRSITSTKMVWYNEDMRYESTLIRTK